MLLLVRLALEPAFPMALWDTGGQWLLCILGASFLVLVGQASRFKLQVHESLIARSDDKSLSPQTRQCIADGFIFFDWFAIPQITARKHGVNEETTKSDAALAVQSIPAYVELSNLFIALVPDLTHKDSGFC